MEVPAARDDFDGVEMEVPAARDDFDGVEPLNIEGQDLRTRNMSSRFLFDSETPQTEKDEVRNCVVNLALANCRGHFTSSNDPDLT